MTTSPILEISHSSLPSTPSRQLRAIEHMRSFILHMSVLNGDSPGK